MKTEFKNIIQNDFPFLKDSKLLVTVSAGIDSVILAHLLHQLEFDISIAHCNFRLRKVDSDLDEQSVNKLAIALNVPFYVTHFDTKQHAKQHKLSIQEAARNLRYEWFEKIRKENELDYILTAHNLNDNLETFLINLSRGTGLKGLTGIPTIHNKIIRPLSSFTRDEIETFANHNNIKWREDKSNTETKYTRNKIRHQVIPILQELNPKLLNSFKQTLKNLQGSKNIIQDTISSVQPKLIASQRTFNIENLIGKINTNPEAYIHEIFSPYGFTNPIDIIDLLSTQSGKQIFSKTHRLIKDRKSLLLVEKKTENRELRTDSFEVFEKGIVLEKNNLEIKVNFDLPSSVFRSIQSTIQTNKSLLKFPLIVRKWQKGDYFYPKGMKGKKKLSKYFKDEKMSLLEKENIWLLLSDNKIVWIIGKRQDERFVIQSKDVISEVLNISIKE